MTKAECFQQLIEKVLGQKCELVPKEEVEGDVQREGKPKEGAGNGTMGKD
jgi:hypothetical protein